LSLSDSLESIFTKDIVGHVEVRNPDLFPGLGLGE
jgi:hypothetical protein